MIARRILPWVLFCLLAAAVGGNEAVHYVLAVPAGFADRCGVALDDPVDVELESGETQ